MARKIRFPLEMKNGVMVRSLEELIENFDIDKVLLYIADGKLERWLRDRSRDDLADAISQLPRMQTILCVQKRFVIFSMFQKKIVQLI